jgi:O-antigen ligase
VLPNKAAAPGADGSRYSRAMLAAAGWSTVATAAALPFSTAGINAFMLLAFLFWALSGRWRASVQAIAAEPAAWWGCAMLSALWLGMGWSLVPAGAAAEAISKYRELALFGIVMFLCLQGPWAGRILAAFFLSCVVLLALSYAIRFGWMHHADPRGATAPDNAVLMKNSITHGFLMSLLAFGAAVLALRRPGWRRWLLLAIALAAAANVWLAVQGRTGYVVLAALCLWLAAARWSVRGLLLALASLAVVLAVLYQAGPTFRARVDKAVHEATQYGQGARDTSIGLRLHFWSRSLQWLAARPVQGAGTGGWSEAFYRATANDPPTLHSRNHQHPHNEYVHFAVQLGPAGFALLAGLFAIAFQRAGRLREEEALLARGLVVAFAIGCLFNDLIWDATEGHVWALLGGSLFGATRGILPSTAPRTA